MADPSKLLQEKHNGERLAVVSRGGSLVGINKTGQTRPLPSFVTQAIATGRDFVIDGEVMGESYRVFDVMEVDGLDIRDKTYLARLNDLRGIASSSFINNEIVYIVHTAHTQETKWSLFEGVRARNGEGVVIRSAGATYVPGRSDGCLKYKFWNSLSAIVVGASDGKRSVRVGLLDDAGQVVDVGAVTVPANQGVPGDGSIVEIRYLYAYPTGALFQPALLGLRNDVLRDECVLTQRVFKAAE